MSGSVSPLPWTGNKGCIYTTIDAFMPPHRTYVEACMGSAEVFLRKKPVEKEIINEKYNFIDEIISEVLVNKDKKEASSESSREMKIWKD